MDTGAKFNEERTHRQRLWRIWDPTKPWLYVIGMNPSTADETENDPTVERCQRRAEKLGYGGIVMLNIMDVIETDSRKLGQMPKEHRCTKENSLELLLAIDDAAYKHADILCAWGKPGQKFGAVAWFSTQAFRKGVTLFCLNKNKDGSPAHPLYQPYSKAFEWFDGVSAENASLPLYNHPELGT